jgi:hypothetical protein
VYPTRPGRLYLTLAVVALLILLYAQQQQTVVIPWSGRIATAVPDAIHGSWFACVTSIVLLFVERVRQGRAAFVATALIGLCIAVGTEVVQGLTGGDAEAGDVFFDMVGMSAALCFWSARRGMARPHVGHGAAALLLVASLWPVVPAIAIERCRDSIAPELIRFDAQCARELYSVNSPAQIVPAPQPWSITGPAVKLMLTSDTSFHLDDPISDWRPYGELDVDVFVAGDSPLPVSVSVRIDNAPVDHVYRTFDCTPGECKIELPLNGFFDRDVARVNAVVVYTSRAAAGRVLYIGRVVLRV